MASIMGLSSNNQIGAGHRGDVIVSNSSHFYNIDRSMANGFSDQSIPCQSISGRSECSTTSMRSTPPPPESPFVHQSVIREGSDCKNELLNNNGDDEFGELSIDLDHKMDTYEGSSPEGDQYDGEKSPNEEDQRNEDGFRSNELKRPDLKGTFRCSICQKVFCHSSSLSRHRMQAHFKSYKCTLCRKEITSNETLRAHMYKQHGISRMFMCRCCNWAFPDKTSLHMHIQAREEGKAVKVSVIGQGIVPPSGDRLSTSGPMGGHLPPGLVTSMTSLDTSNFSPMHPPVNNNTLPPGHHLNMHGQGLPAPSPLSLFSSQSSNAQLPPPSDELLARLRERLMFNQLMASQNGFGLAAAAWMNNKFPVKPDAAAPVLPTTIRESGTVIEAPIPVRPPPLRQEPINVEKTTNEVTSQETQSINNNNSTLETSNASTSCSDIEEQKPTVENGRNDKRPLDSPAGGGSSTDGSSPSHTRTCVSPVETFRRAASSPSAFHPLLKLEQTCAQYPDDVSLHVSPSDSHTTGSPGAETSHSQCYDCQLFRGRLGVVESRCTYLETSNAQLQTELLRSRSGAASSENAVRTLEGDLRVLRDQNDSLRRKLLECQEQTLSFLQSERGNHPNAANMFLNQLLQNIIM